jgi:hypothetical protein
MGPDAGLYSGQQVGQVQLSSSTFRPIDDDEAPVKPPAPSTVWIAWPSFGTRIRFPTGEVPRIDYLVVLLVPFVLALAAVELWLSAPLTVLAVTLVGGVVLLYSVVALLFVRRRN